MARYDAFIIDLWGVVHDGGELYPQALAALHAIHAQGKKVVFLSNAPRKAEKAIANLTRLGIDPTLYVSVVTSGQVAHDMLTTGGEWGERYYYLGPSKDEDILEGLAYTQQSNPAEADFILNTGFEYDYQPEAEIEPLLQKLVSHNLPLLCTNPDLEVVKQDGTRLLCAGWVAARYEALGGVAIYVGKPYERVYDQALSLLGGVDITHVLAIGDNLHTDIAGANRMGIDALLITGGILKSSGGAHPAPEVLATLCHEADAMPQWVAASFAP